jgi:hypothetical protein
MFNISEGVMLAIPGCLHVPAREAEGSWVVVDKKNNHQRDPKDSLDTSQIIKDH